MLVVSGWVRGEESELTGDHADGHGGGQESYLIRCQRASEVTQASIPLSERRSRSTRQTLISHGCNALVTLNNHVLLCFRLRCALESSCNIQTDSQIASTYFHLPIEEDEDLLDEDFIPPNTKHISWVPTDATDTAVSSPPSPSSVAGPSKPRERPPDANVKTKAVINDILAQDDCYAVLGISRSSRIDKLTLRRAYLARSRACHPE